MPKLSGTEMHDERVLSEILPAPDGSNDPWQWLENTSGHKQLAWIQRHNYRVKQELEENNIFSDLKNEIEEILNSESKIPPVVKYGKHLYNFWTDENHQYGIWRRTTLDSYSSENPIWEILLDLDALNKVEQEDWVWHGAELLRPNNESATCIRALINLSHGGTDSDITREFDLTTKTFIPQAEGGFSRNNAKGAMSWIDENTVFISTDFGEGTLTSAGYPRQVRRWRRGTPLNQADVVFEAEKTDLEVQGYRDDYPGHERDWIILNRSIYDSDHFLLCNDAYGRPTLTHISVPSDTELLIHRDLAVLIPRNDWEHHGIHIPAGSLVVADAESFIAGKRDLQVLFSPSPSQSLQELTITQNYLVITVLEDVVHRIETYYQDKLGNWKHKHAFAHLTGSLEIAAVDDEESDKIWILSSDFCTPTTLWLGDLRQIRSGKNTEQVPIKSSPPFFNSNNIRASQHFAISDDGALIPYFQIGPKNTPVANNNPTLMYGYGGFEFSLTPSYLDITGKAWCARGGTYVIANVRGGGEYGPLWHQAAIKNNRSLAYQDFAAVARDLVTREVTTHEKLACLGASNGGLLAGNMLTHYPELFAAIVLQVPLLDMRRYPHLLSGSSWLAEYGDPDSSDWEFMQALSPYHSLIPSTAYPPTLITTSTLDDRVHPGHARKFAAALEALGNNILIWENIEGGHGGAATNAQTAHMDALVFTFLWKTIGKDSTSN